MAKKRGHNEGSINLRKDGRWEARVTVGRDKNGKLVRKGYYGKTRQEVAAKLSAALTEIQKGNELPNEKTTVKAFLEGWLEGTAQARLRESTYARYKTLTDKYLIPGIGSVPLARLSPPKVQKLWSDLQAGGLSGRTVMQVRAILRTALNQAVKHSLASKNAAALTDPPKAASYKPTFLDATQAEALLKAVKGHTKLDGLVTLALTTGMRIGEILGLTWGDIDFEKKELCIRRQQQRVGKKLVVCDPKTERSARTIPLTQLAVDALQRHKEHQKVLLRSGLEAGFLVTGRVFTNETGAPLENATVLRQFQRFVKDAKLPRMRLHDLRHSCATLLLSRGIHPRIVMELLGHSTIAMTMNVYSHVVPEIARTAADQMDAVFVPKQEAAQAQ